MILLMTWLLVSYVVNITELPAQCIIINTNPGKGITRNFRNMVYPQTFRNGHYESPQHMSDSGNKIKAI